jgi:hypothetical protein
MINEGRVRGLSLHLSGGSEENHEPRSGWAVYLPILEGMLKEAVVAYFKALPRNLLKGTE